MAAIPQPQKQRPSGLFASKRGRVILENLTAYLFLAPAGLIIFTFGLFPVVFAFFVSLHKWRRFPEEFRGLDNYAEVLGNFAYVLFFWLAIAILAYALWVIRSTIHEIREKGERAGYLYLMPGATLTLAVLAALNWFFKLLPVVLTIPVRLRGQELSRQIFIGEFFNSFTFPEVVPAANIMIGVVAIAVVVTYMVVHFVQVKERARYLSRWLTAGVTLAGGAWLLRLTIAEIQAAALEALAAGESAPIWSQIIVISAGVGLLVFALWLWNRTVHTHEPSKLYVLRIFVVMAAVVGAVFLIREVPQAFSQADKDVFQGFNVTIMYSMFSVPIQLILGMGLAILLFQNIAGKSFFRVVYFLPYITPFVATSIVFILIFSHSPTSPINQLLSWFGIEPLHWLREPKGIFRIIFGDGLPDFLAGPGLALVVIIIFSVWTYAGYSAVIFLAGLGNIPTDVYEAARIDGANSWQQFRHITLPLLSPTTFFLILIATIGTFQAFTQIFLMRKAGAYAAVDTINLYIYNEITRSTPDYAYGSAMAFVLFAVILTLTLIQNRIVGRRVFYG